MATNRNKYLRGLWEEAKITDRCLVVVDGTSPVAAVLLVGCAVGGGRGDTLKRLRLVTSATTLETSCQPGVSCRGRQGSRREQQVADEGESRDHDDYWEGRGKEVELEGTVGTEGTLSFSSDIPTPLYP